MRWQELAQRPRYESPSPGRPRQMLPLERTLAGGRTPPRQKEISLGEVQNSRGFCRGDNRELLKRTFWACVMQLR